MNARSCYYCVFTINFTVSVDSTSQNREEDKTFFESQRVNEAPFSWKWFLTSSQKFDMATGVEECSFEAVRWLLHLHEWHNKSDLPQRGTCRGLWLEGLWLFSRMEIRILEFLHPPSTIVSQHLLFYWSTWVPPLWDLYSKKKSFTSLVFLSAGWLTVYAQELALMRQRWVLSLCWKRGCNTAADSRARQGKFAIPCYGKVSGAQWGYKYNSFMLFHSRRKDPLWKDL